LPAAYASALKRALALRDPRLPVRRFFKVFRALPLRTAGPAGRRVGQGAERKAETNRDTICGTPLAKRTQGQSSLRRSGSFERGRISVRH
jgi:hypothetical protein